MLETTKLEGNRVKPTIVHLLIDVSDRRSTFALTRPWDVQRGILARLAGGRIECDAWTLSFLRLPWLVRPRLLTRLLLRLPLAVLLMSFLLVLTTGRFSLAGSRSRGLSVFTTATAREQLRSCER